VTLRTFVRSRRKRRKSIHQIAANLEAVTYGPQPIVDLKNKIVLLWSAKAGSVFAIKWMFRQMGLLEEALTFDRWVHHYRMNVFYDSDRYKAGVEDFLQSPSSYRFVKFVRSPFKRAVSSYVYVLQNMERNSDLAKTLIGADQKFTLSFSEFVTYLGTIDLRDCDVHYRTQTHELERQLCRGSMFLLNLDYSMESLPKLESYLGLSQTDPQQYRVSSHHAIRSAGTPAGFAGDQVFEFSDRGRAAVPDYRSFYNRDLEQRVYDLYVEDFLRYGFATAINACDR
jgi:Sulfotransferase family